MDHQTPPSTPPPRGRPTEPPAVGRKQKRQREFVLPTTPQSTSTCDPPGRPSKTSKTTAL